MPVAEKMGRMHGYFQKLVWEMVPPFSFPHDFAMRLVQNQPDPIIMEYIARIEDLARLSIHALNAEIKILERFHDLKWITPHMMQRMTTVFSCPIKFDPLRCFLEI